MTIHALPESPYYTVREVAALLRMSIYTVRRLAHGGAYGALRVGGQWRFPKDAFPPVVLKERRDAICH